MSLISSLMGNASKANVENIVREFNRILAPNEKIEHAFRVIRDLFIFTEKRLIIIDKMGLTGKKIEYMSIPYKSITHFSIQTAGHFDLDAELRIWIMSKNEPLLKNFNRSVNIYDIQKVLADYIFKNL